MENQIAKALHQLKQAGILTPETATNAVITVLKDASFTDLVHLVQLNCEHDFD